MPENYSTAMVSRFSGKTLEGKDIKSRGYIKILEALRYYEDALLELQKAVIHKYNHEVSSYERTTWEKIIDKPVKDCLKTKRHTFRTLSRLRSAMRSDPLKNNYLNHVDGCERMVFSGRTGVLVWRKQYVQLRELVRNGDGWLLTPQLCEFINYWCTHRSMYV